MLCPSCQGKMKVRDSRKRKVRDAGGEIYIFYLRRLICSSCSQIHLEIPDCIEPQKHYFKETIERVVNDKCDYFSGDDKTIWRWKNNL